MKKLIATALLIASTGFSSEFLPFKSSGGKKNALIMLVDASGLNGSCDKLYEKNIKIFKHILSKRSLPKMRLRDIHIILFSDKVNEFFVLNDKGLNGRTVSKRLYTLEESLKNEILQMNKDSGKDIYSSLKYVKELIDERYISYDNIGIILFSNMRQSVNVTKVTSAKNIEFTPNSSLRFYAKSGLSECDKALSSQTITGEKSIKKFWQKKIVSKNFRIYTKY